MYRNETLDDYLNREFAKEGLVNTKTKPAKKMKKAKIKKEKKQHSKKAKALLISSVAVLSAAVIGATAFLANHFGNKKKKYDTNSKKETYSISDLGLEEEVNSSEDSIYTDATNGIDTKQIVSKNGKLYVNSKAAEKSSEVGKSVIDTKGGTLEVKSNGKVYEKNNSEYQVVDKNGNVTSSGTKDSTGAPNGYVYDPVIGGYVKPEEAGKYVRDENGDLVSKEDYEARNNSNKTSSSTSSSNTSSSNTSSSNTSSSSTISEVEEKGHYNADGTYTIYGMTFETKEDFEQYVLQGYQGYGLVNGIMKPMTKEMEEAKQKTK